MFHTSLPTVPKPNLVPSGPTPKPEPISIAMPEPPKKKPTSSLQAAAARVTGFFAAKPDSVFSLVDDAIKDGQDHISETNTLLESLVDDDMAEAKGAKKRDKEDTEASSFAIFVSEASMEFALHQMGPDFIQRLYAEFPKHEHQQEVNRFLAECMGKLPGAQQMYPFVGLGSYMTLKLEFCGRFFG